MHCFFNTFIYFLVLVRYFLTEFYTTDLSFKMYIVVEFLNDNAIEIIPSSWYNKQNSTVKWPSLIKSKHHFRQLLVDKAMPMDDWLNYKAIFIYESGNFLFIASTFLYRIY